MKDVSLYKEKVIMMWNSGKVGWGAWNFGAPLIPVIVLIPMASSEVIFSSMLTYCYALLVLGTYLFDQHSKLRFGAGRDSLFYVSLVAVLILLALLILYNSTDIVKKIANFNIFLSFLVVIILVLPLGYKLNKPLLDKQAMEEAYLKLKLEESKKKAKSAGKSGKNMKNAVKLITEEFDNESV